MQKGNDFLVARLREDGSLLYYSHLATNTTTRLRVWVKDHRHAVPIVENMAEALRGHIERADARHAGRLFLVGRAFFENQTAGI